MILDLPFKHHGETVLPDVEVRLSDTPNPDVSFCLVTRGDVDLEPTLATIPKGWEVVIWNNSERVDYKVYGRFCAAFEANGRVVAFCDDDVVVPEETWAHLKELHDNLALGGFSNDKMVVNDAHGDNPKGLGDVGLTAAGALVSKRLILETWKHWFTVHRMQEVNDGSLPTSPDGVPGFLYECDFVFGVICPHVSVRLPYTNRFPNHGDRLCDQPWQEALKYTYTELARDIRDLR